MKESLKKFIVYFILGLIICIIFYALIKRYDFDGNTMNRIVLNKYYLVFLFLSIVVSLSIYWKADSKSKFLLYFIAIVNVLYLLFLFLIGNIGLNNTQGFMILGFLVLGFAGIYIRNWFGYTIIGLSLLGSLIILYFAIIPLYNEGPDFEGFEKSFDEVLLIYSNTTLNADNAQITKDNRVYNILQGLHSYDLKLGKSGSQLIFKSDDLYQNVYGFIVLKGGDFVELLPQSALGIDLDFQIEILTGNVKYYPSILGEISFVGENQASLEDDEDVVAIVNNWYKENLRMYIKSKMGGELSENKIILKISQKTLNVLSRLFPGKYDDNLRNLQNYLDLFDIDLDAKVKYGKMDGKGAVDNVWGGLKKGIEMVK